MNITLQQWLTRQPYTQTTDSDRYYTRLANRLYESIKQSSLKERWSDEAVKGICCDLVGYFADILSGTGLWSTFLAQYRAFYGRTLPFFSPESYYDGEVAGYIYREIYITSLIGILFGIPVGCLLCLFVFQVMSFGSIAGISWFVWVLAPVLSVIFTILVTLILRHKIVSIDMNQSLKAIE